MSKKFQEVFIPLGEFDPEKFIVSDPVARKSKDGKKTFYRAPIRYLNSKGEECIPSIQAPDQAFFGVMPMAPFGSDLEEDHSNVVDYQILYYMNSKETIEEPTDHEAYFKNIIDVYREKVKDACFAFIKKDKRKKKKNPSHKCLLPNGVMSAITDEDGGVKNPYGPPKEIFDKDGNRKPDRMYTKLICRKKNGKVDSFITTIYGPGDKKMNPLKCEEIMGTLTPVFQFGDCTLTAVTESNFGAFPNIRFIEGNYVPFKTGGNHRRMLASNPKASESSSDSSSEDTEGNDESDEGFERESNPINDLNNVNKDSDESEDEKNEKSEENSEDSSEDEEEREKKRAKEKRAENEKRKQKRREKREKKKAKK